MKTSHSTTGQTTKLMSTVRGGYVGPNQDCPNRPPEECPEGQTGTPPNCVASPPETCRGDLVGTPPNCQSPTHCTCGTFPPGTNCQSECGGGGTSVSCPCGSFAAGTNCNDVCDTQPPRPGTVTCATGRSRPTGYAGPAPPFRHQSLTPRYLWYPRNGHRHWDRHRDRHRDRHFGRLHHSRRCAGKPRPADPRLLGRQDKRRLIWRRDSGAQPGESRSTIRGRRTNRSATPPPARVRLRPAPTLIGDVSLDNPFCPWLGQVRA